MEVLCPWSVKINEDMKQGVEQHGSVVVMLH